MDLPTQLKTSISDLHRRIESSPYAKAIMDGSIDARDYARSLVQFLHIHEALEAQFASHPGLPCYDPDSMSRSESLRRDLAWWGGSTDDAILRETIRLASTFARWGEESPFGLIGALYVFEGSRMGSMYIAKSLSKGLAVPAEPGMGLDYHVDGIAERPKTWRAFLQSLAVAPLSPEESDIVVASAVTTMALLCELYAELPVTKARHEIEVLA